MFSKSARETPSIVNKCGPGRRFELAGPDTKLPKVEARVETCFGPLVLRLWKLIDLADRTLHVRHILLLLCFVALLLLLTLASGLHLLAGQLHPLPVALSELRRGY